MLREAASMVGSSPAFSYVPSLSQSVQTVTPDADGAELVVSTRSNEASRLTRLVCRETMTKYFDGLLVTV